MVMPDGRSMWKVLPGLNFVPENKLPCVIDELVLMLKQLVSLGTGDLTKHHLGNAAEAKGEGRATESRALTVFGPKSILLSTPLL